jgi:nitroreductase/NAD-dependent dihydropyrimidine dehydrogenase PreA subunit
MSHMTVDVNLCKKDGSCVAVCPSGALCLSEDGYPAEFSEARCILCGQCMAVCAAGALAHADMPSHSFEPLPGMQPTPEQMDGLLKSRRSIRAFKEQPVSREVIQACLDIARRAPSANNSQKLHWIVLDGNEKVRELAREMIFGVQSVGMQPRLLEQWENGEDKMLRGAPMVVVACAPTEYAWGKEDAAIALSYFEMAAETRGIGACWAGFLTRIAAVHAPVRWQLKVPNGYSVRGALMVGESKYAYHLIPPRKALSVQWC